jgi:protein-tyrosine phosphatase
MRRIKLKHLYNLRDIGDIPFDLYTVTKSKVLLRSDALVELDEDEKEYLINYGVKAIIDLRNEHEAEKRPNSFANDSRVNYHHIPILNETKMEDEKENAPSSELNDKSLQKIYIDVLFHHQAELKKIFTLIDKYKSGVIVHCSAGKDRTGLTSALLLLLNGVEIFDILADYEISYVYLLPRMYKLLELYPDIKMHIMQSTPDILEFALKELLAHYGTIENYFLKIGLSQAQIDRLKVILH